MPFPLEATGTPAIIDISSDRDATPAREATPEVASPVALAPADSRYLVAPLWRDIPLYTPAVPDASGNAAPIHHQNQMNVGNQRVHQTHSTDASLVEALGEERRRQAMDLQCEQLQQFVSTQRDELRAQGVRIMNEAAQMFRENKILKHEANMPAFVDVHVQRQNQQAESLHLKLRQALKSQSDLQTQLTAVRYARNKNDMFTSYPTVSGRLALPSCLIVGRRVPGRAMDGE